MSSQLARANSSFHGVPKIKLASSNKTTEMKESHLSLN